jgi:Ca2+/Na+ antiporter
MIDLPNWFAGTVTIVALVGLGVFVYPWLLARKGGIVAVAVATVLLALLFLQFDRDSGETSKLSAALAVLWALAPAIVGVIAHRLQRRPPAGG